MSAHTDYPVLLFQDEFTDGSLGWTAEHPDLPGVTGAGRTIPEARESLANAREAYFRLMERLGRDVPAPPEAPVRETREIPQDREGGEEFLVRGSWENRTRKRFWGRRTEVVAHS